MCMHEKAALSCHRARLSRTQTRPDQMCRETFCAYLGQDLFYLTAFAEAYSASLSKAAQVSISACKAAPRATTLCNIYGCLGYSTVAGPPFVDCMHCRTWSTTCTIR